MTPAILQSGTQQFIFSQLCIAQRSVNGSWTVHSLQVSRCTAISSLRGVNESKSGLLSVRAPHARHVAGAITAKQAAIVNP